MSRDINYSEWMYNPVVETLLLPIKSGFIDFSADKALFLNAQYHEGLPEGLHCVSYFKPHAESLQAKGFSIFNDDMFLPSGFFDGVLMVLPKSMVEARYLLARALLSLRQGGWLVCAADNKAGGGRLVGLFTEFGLRDLQTASMNKARVVWARAVTIDSDAVQQALLAGSVLPILDGAIVSQAGIFGWDKIDVGSAILVENFPASFRGKGADFGCGYGFLSRAVVERNGGIESLTMIDADARTVRVCQKNIRTAYAHGLWADITHDADMPRGLDFIVMNPPFHEGKKTDSDLGVAFIRQAARSLKSHGTLWMVANTHLPYEKTLSGLFTEVQTLREQQGFKVLKASK